VLGDVQADAVAELSRRISDRCAGRPQDVEWSVATAPAQSTSPRRRAIRSGIPDGLGSCHRRPEHHQSWFKYRKKNPGGRRGSPVDEIHVDTWDPDWTSEFIDLLTVLARLVELGPALAELLALVLATEVITRDELASDGVHWPAEPSDRKPRYSLGNDIHPGVVTLL
jgi:hypothetical protein